LLRLGLVRQAANDLLIGLREHYPLCCILNFCLDRLLRIPSGISRGAINAPIVGQYVPCHFHKRVLWSFSNAESLELLESGGTHLAPNDVVEVRINDIVFSKVTVPSACDAILFNRVVVYLKK
jgi:hypothetical protein